ncbi:DUF1778 domain-containing protein [Enterococcus sp. 669A]|uniref:DUF1778 domain-containing protein n=1 Tax=Candidatus Enterococcus moelleringii TaxID=2815325 RepID=A0ABS3L905_9ENTE|nr:DUF1778 domain-containing protein [Enterococcus sp. 669A]
MATITFRVSDDEKTFLESVAAFKGDSLSDFVRSEALHSAETFTDFNTFKEFMAQHNEKDESISHDEMMKELGF